MCAAESRQQTTASAASAASAAVKGAAILFSLAPRNRRARLHQAVLRLSGANLNPLAI